MPLSNKHPIKNVKNLKSATGLITSLMVYFLPKMHKNVLPLPGRPICNTINTPAMDLFKWVDIQLQPLVKKKTTFLSPRWQSFLQKINEINKNQTLLPHYQ